VTAIWVLAGLQAIGLIVVHGAIAIGRWLDNRAKAKDNPAAH
jgi:hypothetical protein